MHFLIKDWSKINDIDIAKKVMSSEFYKDQLSPVQVPLDKFKNILVLSPHQDDESIGCGGTLYKLFKSGAKINILYLLNGAQKIKYEKEQIVNIRNKEAINAAEYVNADIYHLGIDDLDPKPNQEDISKLNKIIRKTKPDIVLLPWFLDSPPKHRMVNHLLMLSNIQNPLPPFEVWCYQVHSPLYPNVIINITDEIDVKLKMIRCFKSQIEMKPYAHYALGLSIWNSRYLSRGNEEYNVEIFYAIPSKTFYSQVNKFYLNNLQQTYKNRPLLMERMAKLTKDYIN